MKTSVVGQWAFGIPLAKHLQTNEVCDIKEWYFRILVSW